MTRKIKSKYVHNIHARAHKCSSNNKTNISQKTGRSTPECLTEREQVKHVTENKTTLLYQ